MTPEDKRELKVRRAVALADELVPLKSVGYEIAPNDYYRKWSDVFTAMVAPEWPATVAEVSEQAALSPQH